METVLWVMQKLELLINIYKMDNTQEDYKKSYENLQHYFEEQLGYRPKLNKFETFLVNDLSIPRKYVQPRWSIGLDRIIKNTNKPILPTVTNNFLDQTIKLIKNKKLIQIFIRLLVVVDIFLVEKMVEKFLIDFIMVNY